MSDPLEGTIYAAGRNAIKHGLEMNGETAGSAAGKILLFFPKMIWKLFVLIFKLYGFLLYVILGGITCLAALLLKVLDKISFLHFFSFFGSGYGASSSKEMSTGKRVVITFLKVFGTILYFLIGLIIFIMRGILKFLNLFSWGRFYNNFLGI